MRNKIFTILGIAIVFVAISTYVLLDANVKNNSDIMGTNILVAKEDIVEGTVVRDIEQAYSMFDVKKMAQADITPNAIEVSAVSVEADGIINKIKGFFMPNEYELSREDLINIVNRKITSNIYKNQQILNIYLTEDNTEFAPNERYFAVPTSYVGSVGAEVMAGDYVDIWISYDESNNPQKVIEALKVVKVKDANNVENSDDVQNIPSLVVFKLTEEQIVVISQKMGKGSLFLTKWGITPQETGVIVINNNKTNKTPEKTVEEVIVDETIINESIDDDVNQEDIEREDD